MHNIIKNSIIFQKDSDGKIIKKRASGSSVDLNQIDLELSKRKLKSQIHELLKTISEEEFKKMILNYTSDIKTQFSRTHDGFRLAKGVPQKDRLTISDLFIQSLLAAECFSFIPQLITKKEKIGLGVMTPGVQDVGKNLIKLLWKSDGYEILDLGIKAKPPEWITALKKEKLDVLGISCMRSKCLPNLKKLLTTIKEEKLDPIFILGGIAVNRLITYKLSKEFDLRIYYGQDLTDAQVVLKKALSDAPIEIPNIKATEQIDLSKHLKSNKDNKQIYKAYNINISDIVVDQSSRNGCSMCEGDKKMNCPLQTGYEDQQSLEESKDYINQFKFANLIITKLPDNEDRKLLKSIWENLINIEKWLNTKYNEVVGFRFPIVCPMCKPKECQMDKGKCMLPNYYRTVPEKYNIHMSKTLSKVFGDGVLADEMCSIIFIK